MRGISFFPPADFVDYVDDDVKENRRNELVAICRCSLTGQLPFFKSDVDLEYSFHFGLEPARKPAKSGRANVDLVRSARFLDRGDCEPCRARTQAGRR